MGWCFHIVFGICQVLAVSGGGTGLFRLLEYLSSQTGRITAGSTAVVCVGLAAPNSRCLYGRTTFTTDQYTDRAMFESQIKKVTGLHVFRFTSLTPGLMMTVGEVDWDVDIHGDEEKSSRSISFLLTGPPDLNSSVLTRTETATTQVTNLTLAYVLVCDEYYYGDCSTYCRPKHPMYDCDRAGQRICLTAGDAEVPPMYDCDRAGQRTCLTGWTGALCDVKDDTCGTNPCLHGGTCTNIPHNHHFCMCTPEWTGYNCETPMHSSSGE